MHSHHLAPREHAMVWIFGRKAGGRSEGPVGHGPGPTRLDASQILAPAGDRGFIPHHLCASVRAYTVASDKHVTCRASSVGKFDPYVLGVIGLNIFLEFLPKMDVR